MEGLDGSLCRELSRQQALSAGHGWSGSADTTSVQDLGHFTAPQGAKCIAPGERRRDTSSTVGLCCPRNSGRCSSACGGVTGPGQGVWAAPAPRGGCAASLPHKYCRAAGQCMPLPSPSLGAQPWALGTDSITLTPLPHWALPGPQGWSPKCPCCPSAREREP